MARAAAEAPVMSRRPSRLRAFLENAGQAAGLAEHGIVDSDPGFGGIEGKKIVVVSTEPEFANVLIGHAVGVAGRLGARIVALTVGRPEEELPAGHKARARELFLARADKSAEEFRRQAREAGVVFQHVVRFGRAADVVESECSRLRRVEFVLTLKEQHSREGFRVSMPLFEVAR